MAKKRSLATKQEVLEHLKISISTLDRLIKSKKIKFQKIGRIVRFDLNNLFVRQESAIPNNKS